MHRDLSIYIGAYIGQTKFRVLDYCVQCLDRHTTNNKRDNRFLMMMVMIMMMMIMMMRFHVVFLSRLSRDYILHWQRISLIHQYLNRLRATLYEAGSS